MWDHHNEALHNSQSYWNDSIESKINDQVQDLYSHGLQAIPRKAFVFSQEQSKKYFNIQSHTKNNGWCQSEKLSNKSNITNMVHLYPSNKACIDGLAWRSPINTEAGSGRGPSIYGPDT